MSYFCKIRVFPPSFWKNELKYIFKDFITHAFPTMYAVVWRYDAVPVFHIHTTSSKAILCCWGCLCALRVEGILGVSLEVVFVLLNIPSSNKYCQVLVLLMSILEGFLCGLFLWKFHFLFLFIEKQLSTQCYESEIKEFCELNCWSL